MNSHPYILGSGDAELDRLARQHDVWRQVTRGLWQSAGFSSGQRILDLGCGPGFGSFELAKLVGDDGQVIAMDNSERFLGVLQDWCEERNAKNVEVRQGDAYSPGIEAASLDGIFARWLLCFLPDTARIIQSAAQMLAPGGRIAVMDYFHYLSIECFPPSEIFTHVFRSIYQSFADSGGDLDVGGKLPELMRQAGLNVVHIEPIVDTARPGSDIWQWVRTFQSAYLPQLVEKGYLSEDDLLTNDAHWREQEQNPASFFLSPPMVGVVAQKPS